jgi:tyrosine aminotransferase
MSTLLPSTGPTSTSPMVDEKSSSFSPLSMSKVAARTRNPIRAIVDSMKRDMSDPRSHIPLSLGDPTIFGNLLPPAALTEAVEKSLKSSTHNGYVHSAGSAEARRAVAERTEESILSSISLHGSKGGVSRPPLTFEDVIMASGCSGAIELCISTLLDEDDLLLVPAPGFPLYTTISDSRGVRVRHYRLLPEKKWEVDLNHLEEIVASEVADPVHLNRKVVILVNNPSNPCGSVYSREHLSNLLAFANKWKLPIIADEIYANVVFPGEEKFTPMASISEYSNVPIVSAGGIAKEFFVPGWRIGWVVVHETSGEPLMSNIRRGIVSMTQLIMAANSLCMSALPSILRPAKGSESETALAKYKADSIQILTENASLCVQRTRSIKGLTAIAPQGAMYLMIGIDCEAFGFKDDVEFSQLLLKEQNVFVLPGQCFTCPNFVRIVSCAPAAILNDAFDRIEAFCESRRK